MKQWASAMLDAWHKDAPKPARMNPDATIEEAYDAQRHYVNLRSSPVSGYKAALTSSEAQTAFSMNSPIAGVIFEDGNLDTNSVVSTSSLISPLIETEIGFTVGQTIEKNVSAEDLPALLSNWMPMIEIPDLGFTSRPSIGDIIASNAVAACYLKSDLRLETNTAKDVVVKLYKDEQLLHEGCASDTMGDPFEAAAWLINHTLKQGHRIQAGQFLMTGSLGAAHPAKPGKYRAEYRDLKGLEFGNLNFTVS